VHEGEVRVEVVEDEGDERGTRGRVQVRFYGRDGRRIPAVPAPPVLGPDPVGALVKAQREAGVEPDGWTATPQWHGEALDLHWAVQALLGLGKGRGPVGGSEDDGDVSAETPQEEESPPSPRTEEERRKWGRS
jgi:hypothetical protein